MNSATRVEMPVISFSAPTKWRQWLEENHNIMDGAWLKIFRKGSGIPSVYYATALEEALCFGWIDGQAKKYDEQSYIQKFTPRRPKSLWSKRNIGIVEQLEKEGRMTDAGRRAIEAAKADGRWEKAYDSSSSMVMPEDFMKALAENQEALDFYMTLNKANTYAIGWRLQTAKRSETRAKRMQSILEMMARKEKLHNS
jgi:uncharacterized protein YdeI (YjbR/CyaY-like superfamily)